MRLEQQLSADFDEDLLEVLALFLGKLPQVNSILAQAAANQSQQLTGDRTHQGDKELKADLAVDAVFAEALANSTVLRCFLSEERQAPEQVSTDGELAIAYDPLDGSENMLADAPAGSIFGIWRIGQEQVTPELFKSNTLEAAGYILYGRVVKLILATKNTVKEFIVSEVNSKPQLTLVGNVCLPEQADVCSFNNWRSLNWSTQSHSKLERFVESFDYSGFKFRFLGCLAADAHQILKRGGIYCVVPTEKKPRTIRLIYEGLPMAFIAERAQAMAIDLDGSRILDLTPSEFHQRVSFSMGTPAILGQLKDA